MSKYTVIRADLETDREVILDLWCRNLPAHTPDEHRAKYVWHYLKNPIAPGRIWLAVTEEGKTVGTAAIGMRQVCLYGQSVLAGVASDYAVDADHRSIQAALLLARGVVSSLDDDVAMVYGLPNKNAIGVFRRIGYHIVGPLRRFVKVLRSEQYLRSSKIPDVVRPVLGMAIDLALRARGRETWHRVRGRIFKQLDDFDWRIDDLRRRAAPTFPIAGLRSRPFLCWRYLECPLQRHFVLALLSRDESAICAYAVCYLGEKRQLQIVDILAEPLDGVLDDLLGCLLPWAYTLGAASVAIELLGAGPAPAALQPSLKRFAFVERDDTDTLAVFCKDPQHNPLPLDRVTPFYFLRGDEAYNTM